MKAIVGGLGSGADLSSAIGRLGGNVAQALQSPVEQVLVAGIGAVNHVGRALEHRGLGHPVEAPVLELAWRMFLSPYVCDLRVLSVFGDESICIYCI